MCEQCIDRYRLLIIWPFLCSFFCWKNWFSRKILEINQWNFKHRNYLVLSIQWFQARCWVFCRLGVRILQKWKKITTTISTEFDPWLKNYICCGCFWVAMARHAATGHLYIAVEIYPGQKDWIPRTQANIALIGIGCWKVSEFSI